MNATARVSFDSVSGVSQLQAKANFFSEFVDVAVDISYVADPICYSPPSLLTELQYYNPVTFIGEVCSHLTRLLLPLPKNF